MSSRIEYDIHTPFGRRIAELMQTLVAAKNQSANLKAALDAMASGGSFGQVETEVGGMAAGSGEAVYNILAGVNTKLSSNTFDDLWKLFQG